MILIRGNADDRSLLVILDCKIRYHTRKANVVADALSRKERVKPLRVKALVMTIGLDLTSRILEAQREVVKIENIEAEDNGGMLKKSEHEADIATYVRSAELVLSVRYPVYWAEVGRSATSGLEICSPSTADYKKKIFKIRDRMIGPVAYRLELPQELSRVHNVFHVCNLKKCLSDDTLVIPLEEIQLDDKLNFIEEPVEIIDREVKNSNEAVYLSLKSVGMSEEVQNTRGNMRTNLRASTLT
ncbi:hypothetical protein Tco_0352123 [Tanacetum coccineum]